MSVTELTSATRMACWVGTMKQPRSCLSAPCPVAPPVPSPNRDATAPATSTAGPKTDTTPTHPLAAHDLIRLRLDRHELEPGERHAVGCGQRRSAAHRARSSIKKDAHGLTPRLIRLLEQRVGDGVLLRLGQLRVSRGRGPLARNTRRPRGTGSFGSERGER